MDLKLVERFLSAMMPRKAEAKEAVNIAFTVMRAHPSKAVPSISGMLGRFQHQLYSMEDADAASAASLVLTGVMLAWASEDKFLKECILEHYLSNADRMLGKNVVSFFDKKAGRDNARI